MNTPVTVSYDDFDPITVTAVTDIDELLTRIADDQRYKQLPVLVTLRAGESTGLLRVLLGHHRLSTAQWYGCEEPLCSIGTVRQPPGFAYNDGGRRTSAYPGSLIPVELGRLAVREFLSSGGSRPNCVQWQSRRFG
jgi:hypothetical protein